MKAILEMLRLNPGANVCLISYESASELPLREEIVPDLDSAFQQWQADFHALLSGIQALGNQVRIVSFDPALYQTWLGSRQDTRETRSEWAASPSLVITARISPGSNTPGNIGWAVLQSGGGEKISGGEFPMERP